MRRTRARIMAVVSLVMSMVGAAGCGANATPAHQPSAAAPSASHRPAAGDDCGPYQAGGRPVYFGSGDALAGYLYGTGPTGIVFAHESGGDACDWMPEAGRLAGLGYRTLAIDFDGYGASRVTQQPIADDVDDAASFLVSQGVTSVVLVGSSMGGTAVLAAATQTKARLAAVIALSSPSSFSGIDALGAAPHITVPLLLMCGTYDTEFVGDVKDIYAAATATKHKQLVLADTSDHGKLLVESGPAGQPEPYAAYTKFLATYAPPAG